jgi:hypothetical protein
MDLILLFIDHCCQVTSWCDENIQIKQWAGAHWQMPVKENFTIAAISGNPAW